MVVGVSDSLGAVVAVAFGALLLEGSLVVLHSLVRNDFLASTLGHASCLKVVLPLSLAEITWLACRVESSRSLGTLIQDFV